DVQRGVDEAAAKADGKFKSAMQNIASLVADIKIAWYGFVSGISDAISKAGVLYDKLRGISGAAAGTSFKDVFEKYKHPSDAPLPPERPGEESAGAPRARYQTYADAKKGGSSAGTSQIESYIQGLQKAA